MKYIIFILFQNSPYPIKSNQLKQINGSVSLRPYTPTSEATIFLMTQSSFYEHSQLGALTKHKINQFFEVMQHSVYLTSGPTVSIISFLHMYTSICEEFLVPITTTISFFNKPFCWVYAICERKAYPIKRPKMSCCGLDGTCFIFPSDLVAINFINTM